MNIHLPRLFLACALALPFVAGCAVFNRNNTPTLNFVHDHMVPKEAPGKYLVMPLAIPAGLVAVLVDMVIVHPVTVADDAFYDTGDALWSDMDWKGRYVTESATLVPRTVFTPIVFVFDFLGRSCFDIPARGEATIKPRRDPTTTVPDRLYSEAAIAEIAEAHKAYSEGRYEDGIAAAARAREADARCFAEVTDLRVACLVRLHRDQEWMRLWVKDFGTCNRYLLPDMAVEAARIMREGAQEDRVRLLMFLDRNRTDALMIAVADTMPQFVAGDDRAMAMRCLTSLDAWTVRSSRSLLKSEPQGTWRRKVIEVIESAAQSPDATIAAEARLILQRLDDAGKQ